MTNSATYDLTNTDAILSHLLTEKAYTLHDGVTLKNPRIDAEARSGDYFTTLATRLEIVSEEIAKKFPGPAQVLEILTADLEYLQNHYVISPKLRAGSHNQDI